VSQDEAAEGERGRVDTTTTGRDPESSKWIESLSAPGSGRAQALERLHGLLLRAARSEARRRQPHVRIEGVELEDLCHQAADDALVSITNKLETFRGESRFTTWAYKFAVFEISVKLRRHTWATRTIPTADDDSVWERLDRYGGSTHSEVEATQLLRALRVAVMDELTPRQREVFVSAVLNEVPIDVLAERLQATRGAVYKILHDARRKLRRRLALGGYVEEEEQA
jgi:RNA polymerase sigma-70 factor (ECF subfamily)